MGFLRKLFGGEKKPYVDERGLYFYVKCERCGQCVRVRADRQFDLLDEGDGYTWHKTIVDSRCFRPMPTVVRLNRKFEVVNAEISGGRYITEAEYEACLAEQQAAKAAAAAAAAEEEE
jgi:hypothetical protein